MKNLYFCAILRDSIIIFIKLVIEQTLLRDYESTIQLNKKTQHIPQTTATGIGNDRHGTAVTGGRLCAGLRQWKHHVLPCPQWYDGGATCHHLRSRHLYLELRLQHRRYHSWYAQQ